MSENEKKFIAIPFVVAVIGGVMIALLSALLGFCVVSSWSIKWTGQTDVPANPLTQFFENVSDK